MGETDAVEKLGKAKKGIRFPVHQKESTTGFSRLVESDKFGKLTSSTDMLFNSGRDENKRMKAVFGVFSGIMIGGLIYVLLVYSFDYSHLVAGIMVALITILMCVALALWSACRCVMALVFPNFFTSKGRGVMMSIILSLLLSGPIQNITDNSRETGSSMACIAEVVANQTKVLRNQLAEPMIQMAEYAAKNKKKLAEAQKDITNVIDAFMNNYRSVEKAMQDAKDQMNGIYQVCCDSMDIFYLSGPFTSGNLFIWTIFVTVQKLVYFCLHVKMKQFQFGNLFNMDFSHAQVKSGLGR